MTRKEQWLRTFRKHGPQNLMACAMAMGVKYDTAARARRTYGVKFRPTHVLTSMTDQQKEWALQQIADGRPRHAIADELGISRRAMGRHLAKHQASPAPILA